MPPVIKIYKVPPTSSFTGVSDPNAGNNWGLEPNDYEYADIKHFVQETMYPVGQGQDYINTDDLDYDVHEISVPHYLKVMLEAIDVGETQFKVPSANNAYQREWVTAHIHEDFIPQIYIQQQHRYAVGEETEVWQFTHVPRYSEDREEYYSIDFVPGTGTVVTFTAKFSTDLENGLILTDSFGEPITGYTAPPNVFATFYYFLAEGESSPLSQPTFMPPSGDYVDMTTPYIEATEDNTNWYPVYGLSYAVPNPSGEFFNDEGYFTWNSAPAGVKMRITGYRHTWERIINSDSQDIGFRSGETRDGYISSKKSLVRDLSVNYPWYMYTDVKVVNESADTPLESFSLYPVVRGVLDPGTWNIITGFNGLIDQQRPWDVHEGTAMETSGYQGAITSQVDLTVCSVMAWEAGNGTNDYDNCCLPNGIPADPIVGRRYSFRDKFPEPCITSANPAATGSAITYQGAENTVNYFKSTRSSNNAYSFVESSQVIQTNGLWEQNNASSNPLRMILPNASWAVTGPAGSHEPTPVPGTIFARVLWTYRDFTNPAFEDSFRDDVEENQGGKAWTLKVSGKYYS